MENNTPDRYIPDEVLSLYIEEYSKLTLDKKSTLGLLRAVCQLQEAYTRYFSLWIARKLEDPDYELQGAHERSC